jgi:Type VI secretion system effector, Hcp
MVIVSLVRGGAQLCQTAAGRGCRTVALALATVIAVTGGPSIAAAKSKVIGTLAVDGITTAGPVPILAVDWDAQIVGGKGVVSSFVILKFPDATSPLLFLAALSGSPSLSAQIVAEGKGGVSTSYDLADVVVSRVNVDPGNKGELIEEVRLDFARMTVTAAGVSKCWDVVMGLEC